MDLVSGSERENEDFLLSCLYNFKNKIRPSKVLVAHTCTPSYSGGRDQEDGSLKPAQANSSGALS
jgi:hypothetical protein